MKNLRYLILGLLLVATTSINAGTPLIKYVDPRIGTGAHNGDYNHGNDPMGACMPAVLEPYGMNFWTPQTEPSEKHRIVPYYDNRTRLQGFRASHFIDGSATQDYGSVTIMPMLNELKPTAEKRASKFSHDEETMAPDYYSVPLYGGDIFAEMTGTSRTGIFRFTFRRAGKAYILFTPNSDRGEGSVSIDPATSSITGENPAHRLYLGNGQPAGFSGHFLMEVDHKTAEYGVCSGDEIFAGQKSLSHKKQLAAYLAFPVKAGETVIVRVATSFVDVDGARKNMRAECPTWNFNKIRKRLNKIWERQLSALTVSGVSEEEMVKFYTSLYRCCFSPHVFNDVDGRYPQFAGGKTIEHSDGEYFEDYSLWDTFRALHPLITLLYPDRAAGMMQSFVDKYRQSGWMPMFSAWNNYTQEMIGDHGAAIIAEAYVKGIRNFDYHTALEAMVHQAFNLPENKADYQDGKGRRALDSYMKYGYIPLEDPVDYAYHGREQTSRTLEYAYDDYCVAVMADSLGQKDIAEKLYRRAQNYRNVFDPRTGYVGGRHADGHFTHDNRADRGHSFITQGTPCQYSWYVPHDVKGLMACMGGRQEYLARLDSMFSEKRMWHGNEPGHQISFMNNYAGEAWKTQREVRNIMETEYHTGANGYSGNDDSGQMSAWYVFAALGFYPVCPVSAEYALASPSFPKAEIRLHNGRKFIIEARNASRKNIYVQRCWLNGKPYTSLFLKHSDIIKGGKMVFEMGATPMKN